MLFSIYSASLIALSSGIALEKRAVLPAGQTNCKLHVTVGGVGMGWERTQKLAILSVVSIDGYDCTSAVIFVRFIYTSVDTFPQKAKIAVYSKERLGHMGWLYSEEDNVLRYVESYDVAIEFTLQGAAGNTQIHWNGRTIRKSDPAGENGDSLGISDNGGSQNFEWANGNPQQILPSDAKTLYLCDKSDMRVNTVPVFRTEKMTAGGFECSEVLWILSVTG